MLNFKDYIWKRVRINALFYWIILCGTSSIIYAGMLFFLKERNLVSSLKIAAYTIYDSMEASDWSLALGHLINLNTNGPLFNMKLSGIQSDKINLAGPFGEKSFGIGVICKHVPVADEIGLQGCMIIFGIEELLTLFFIFLLVSILFLFIYKFYSTKMLYFISKISYELKKVSCLSKIDKIKESQDEEQIAEIVSIRNHIFELLAKTEAASKALALNQLSSQVAHDIRSPLVVLDLIFKDIKNFSEEKRIMIRGALNRINDIANNLLNYYRQQNDTNIKKQNSMSLVLSMIDGILSEKRTQFRNRNIQFELEIDKNAHLLFSKINPTEFKRMISNLINNSVEANANHIVFFLIDDIKNIIIEIRDNGCGMPDHILNHILTFEASYGKKEGHGLGLQHAKNLIALCKGKMDIISELQKGTTVSLKLPKDEVPAWFPEKLNIHNKQKIIVFDDDSSIFHLWRERLKQFKSEVKFTYFHEVQTFENWISNVQNTTDYLFLMDYEMINSKENGLDLISKYEINNAILVTSRHEEQLIIDRCIALKIHLLPKSIATIFPINLVTLTLYDAVLIDDDALIHQLWSLSAEEHRKNLKFFDTPADFYNKQHLIDRCSSIYIDSNLKAKQKGEIIAKYIYKLGFKNIYITTGKKAYEIESYSYIKGVINKSPPWLSLC